MNTIKLSQLNPNDFIFIGKRHELATVSLLLYRIYEGMKLPNKPFIITVSTNNKSENFFIDIDLTKQDITKDFKCWVCNRYLGDTSNYIDCPEHPYSKNKDYAPEYVYTIKSN